MISAFDDYPIHQTSSPIAQPGPSDRNYYDRYWFNGFEREGAFVFEVGFGQYPNRFVQDGHFTVSLGGVQHSFHTSGRAPEDRAHTVSGPLRIEVVKPLRITRVVLESNDSGIEVDLTFRGRTVPTEEPKNVMHEGTRLIMETSRFTQFGTWEGTIKVDGKTLDVSPATTLGIRDRSWGLRPVGEGMGGAPAPSTEEPGVYWCWSPVHFDDVCTQFGTFEDHAGHATQLSAAMVPAYASVGEIPEGREPGHQEMTSAKHRIKYEKGTRRPASAELELVARDGDRHVITLEPMIRCQVMGIGYQHPEWGHGIWHGEEATGHESWVLADLDPLDYKHIHLHSICKATMKSDSGQTRTGVATIETLCFGTHEPSGFKDFLDGAE